MPCIDWIIGVMLHVESLSKSFKKQLFSPVSFRLSEGEILQITGANGSGKTTLLKCLAGYLEGSYQKLTFRDRPLEPIDTAFATTDERSFFPKLTLFENLIFFKKFYRSKVDYKDFINLFGIDSHLNHEFQTCSTGFRKRLTLLRALIKNSPILLFDEPFANIDPVFTCQLQNFLFHSPQMKEKTIIFSSNTPMLTESHIQTLQLMENNTA